MAICVRSPRFGFGRGGRGGSGSSGSGSSGGSGGSPSRTGSGRIPAPDPGLFGNLGSGDSEDLSSGSESQGNSNGGSGGSSSGSANQGGHQSTKSSNGVGGVRISPAVIGCLVGTFVAIVFLMSCIHFWSREKKRSFNKDTRLRYEQVLWKSIQVITGIMLITWLWKKCTRPKKSKDPEESEDLKPRDSSVDQGSTTTYPVFGFINGDYQIVHYPGYLFEEPPRSGNGDVAYTPYVPESPVPALSPGRGGGTSGGERARYG